MSFRNTVEFAHMTLGLIPKFFNPVDMISLVCKEFGGVDPKRRKLRHTPYVVASPEIRIDKAVRHDFTLKPRGPYKCRLDLYGVTI